MGGETGKNDGNGDNHGQKKWQSEDVLLRKVKTMVAVKRSTATVQGKGLRGEGGSTVRLRSSKQRRRRKGKNRKIWKTICFGTGSRGYNEKGGERSLLQKITLAVPISVEGNVGANCRL